MPFVAPGYMSERQILYAVLTETKIPMTSAQIWDHAKLRGYDKLQPSGGQKGDRDYPSMNRRATMEFYDPKGMLTRELKWKGGRKVYHYSLKPDADPSPKCMDRSRLDNYLYKISDPVTGTPLYFGIGMMNGYITPKRMMAHLSGQSHNRELMAAIASLRKIGREPKPEVVMRNMDRLTAEREEAKMIAKHGRRGFEDWGVLFNKQLRFQTGTTWDLDPRYARS